MLRATRMRSTWLNSLAICSVSTLMSRYSDSAGRTVPSSSEKLRTTLSGSMVILAPGL